MSTKRTIAYVIDDLGFGGAQRQLSILATSLPEPFRPVVIVLSSHTHPFADRMRSRGVEIFVLPRRGHHDLTRLWGLRAALRRTGADLVHGFLDAANVYAFAGARATRRPVLLSLRNERLRLTGFRARVLRWMLRRADAVLVNSKPGRTLLKDELGVPAGRVHYVRNWFGGETEHLHTEAMRSGTTVPQDRHVIGFVGRFAPQKRLHLLIDAFHILHGTMPHSRLLLMGDGRERAALVAHVRALDLGDHVDFVAPDPDVASVMSELRCLVLPSAYEGLPNVALEALSLGVPVVATRAGDIGDVVDDGRTGVLIDGSDPKDVARAIARVLSDTAIGDRARIEGPALIRREFSLQAALERLLPMYESLMKPR